MSNKESARIIPIADELDLECDPEDGTGATQVNLSGFWFVDERKLKAFSDRLAELLSEYQI
ncbi:MAG: hypothetical protein RKH07_12545 [Gammaproteobacteria bacterium]